MLDSLTTDLVGAVATLALGGAIAALAARDRRVPFHGPLSGLLSNPVPAEAIRVEARGAVRRSDYGPSGGRVAA